MTRISDEYFFARARIADRMAPSREKVVLTKAQIAWLAGYLETNGNFICGTPQDSTKPVFLLEGTHHSIFRVARLLERKPTRLAHGKIRVRMTGKPAIVLMVMVRSHMTDQRQDEIDLALRYYRPDRR